MVAKLKGAIPHLVEEGLSILQFADDDYFYGP
jgi:hypothetical protein